VLAIVLTLTSYFLIDAHELVKANEMALNEQKVLVSLIKKESENQANKNKELEKDVEALKALVSELQMNAKVLPYKYGLKEVEK